MSLKKFLVTFLLLALLGSLIFNGILFYVLKEYYTDLRLAKVFPNHEQFYQQDNAALAAKTPTQKRVVLFGDSRIQQWKNLPNIEEVEFINRGIGGETTAQLRARLQTDVLALNPDVVILQLGINDLVTIGAAPRFETAIVQQCQDNLIFLVETLRQNAIQVVLLSIIPPAKPSLTRLPVWSEHIPQRVTEINQYWLNQSMSNVQVIDTAKVLQNDAGVWHQQVNKDTLHLTPTGYEFLNQAVIKALSQS